MFDELNQRAVFCAIREYITSPNYGDEDAEKDFYKELQEVETTIEGFSVPLSGLYGKRAWKYFTRLEKLKTGCSKYRKHV